MSRWGFSRERLRRLDDALRVHVARGAIAGAVALLARHEDLHLVAVGSLAPGANAPMRADTIFRITSMTKPIAAAAAMMLVEEAKLHLDDPVDALLPELADRRVLRSLDSPLEDTIPAARPITLRDLLTFRAGIGVVFEASDLPIQRAMQEAGLAAGPYPPALAPDEMMRRYGALPLMHQPGTVWRYHNAYDMLGVLIARAADMPLEQFLAQRLFAPLGMKDTGFAVPAEKRARLAALCTPDAEGALRIAEAPLAVQPSGSTGMFSTAEDFLAFGCMMLQCGRHGSERLLARPTVELMTTDHITPDQKAASPFFPGFWDNQGWGFGVTMITRRTGIADVPGRYGWMGGLGTSWSTDPHEGLVGILMLQRPLDPEVSRIHADAWTLAYQAIED